MYSGDQNSEYIIHNGRIDLNRSENIYSVVFPNHFISILLSNPNFFNILYLSRYANL